jgi:hypothetical protein
MKSKTGKENYREYMIIQTGIESLNNCVFVFQLEIRSQKQLSENEKEDIKYSVLSRLINCQLEEKPT